MSKGKKELGPCPFCGNKKLTEDDVLYFEQANYSVICSKCYAMGPYGKTEELAMAVWNKRAKVKAKVAEVSLKKWKCCKNCQRVDGQGYCKDKITPNAKDGKRKRGTACFYFKENKNE